MLPTDKSGKFAIMSRNTYEKAGLKHVKKKDREVDGREIWESQKEINGHVAMLIKCFRIGSNWNQTDRIRKGYQQE